MKGVNLGNGALFWKWVNFSNLKKYYIKTNVRNVFLSYTYKFCVWLSVSCLGCFLPSSFPSP